MQVETGASVRLTFVILDEKWNPSPVPCQQENAVLEERAAVWDEQAPPGTRVSGSRYRQTSGIRSELQKAQQSPSHKVQECYVGRTCFQLLPQVLSLGQSPSEWRRESNGT